MRAGRDGDVVVVEYYDGDRGEVPADLVRSPEPDVPYARGACVEAFCAEDRQFHRATVDGTGADGPRSEGGKRILLDNSPVYVRFLPFVSGRVHLGRISDY